MKPKKIINIVFYKYFDSEGEKKSACIFYRDGSSSLVSYEEGLDACEIIVRERNITSVNAFKEMINREIVHVVSREDFLQNFDNYVSHDPLDYDSLDNAIEESMQSVVASLVEDEDDLSEENDLDGDKIVKDDSIEEELDEEEALESLNHVEDTDADEKEALESLNHVEDTDADREEKDNDDASEIDTNDETLENNAVGFKSYTNSDDKKEESHGIFGFFKKQINKIKESKVARRITAFVVALAVGLGAYSCSSRKTAVGQMFNSNLGNHTRVVDDPELNNNTAEDVLFDGAVVYDDNSYYDNYSYNQLLEVTNSNVQKKAMTRAHDTLEKFNGTFASAYVEPGKDVRPALSFEEVMALQVAYNNYSKDDIKAIFNGSDFEASKYSRAYRDASLQLMGAYAIETSANPVDMSGLIDSEEGRAFYQRYHEMFLAAKEATGDEKIALVNKFYQAVLTDFPVTDDVRTEGIAHADTYAEIMEKDGAIAVTPMIAAAEMMWQNLDIDYTLTDSQIDFLNDIGLCNQVDKKFERIETITLGMCHEDETNPTYEQYRNAIIKEMKEKNIYVIDDAHRELTKLDAFQNAVNWHFQADGEWVYSGGFYETTETYTETNTWSESETTYREVETRTEKKIPLEEKRKIDAEIENENDKARQEGEKEAEENRQRMQAEEDKKAEELRSEIEADEKDLQDKIDDANDQIDKNHDNDSSNDRPVNERDLEHGVDFDDNHSDENGNLDDSVENITTDPTGDKTNDPLPDPEVTGAEFDAEADIPVETTVQEPVEEPTFVEVESEPVVEEPTYEEYTPIVYEEVVSEDGSGYYEEVVNNYVESLADESEVEVEEAYEYHR